MKKDKLLQIRISDSEYEELKERAKMQGITVSELVRDTVRYTGTETIKNRAKRINNMLHEINKEIDSWL